jgi:hypothetical protein
LQKKSLCGGVSDADLAQLHILATSVTVIAVRDRSYRLFVQSTADVLLLQLARQRCACAITANQAVMVDVSVLSLPAGDYDFNGVVDAADLAVWQSTFGSTINAAAGGNENGIVDTADYNIWPAGVPEPSTIRLLIAGSVFLTTRRQRRRCRV